jgi:Spy/CpxP family protein refolding chaperone
MKNYLIKIGAAAFIICLLTQAGWAGRRDKRGGHFKWLKNPEVVKELGLTETQQKKIKDVIFESLKKAIQLRAEKKILRLELKHIMGNDNPDKNQIYKLVEKAGEKHTALMKNRIDTKLKTKEILTPKQIKKLKEIKRKFMTKKRKRMKHKRGLYGHGKGQIRGKK